MGDLNGDDRESLRHISPRLKDLISEMLASLKEIGIHCDRCLGTQRYQGNVVLMLVDASFTSIGLNYFKSIVPKIIEFRKRFGMRSLKELANAEIENLLEIWRNRRSWNVAIESARYLMKLSDNDREALRLWAKSSRLENWEEDPIGKISGVGLITYQYLRMMGGIDTVMPDKIVRRVLSKIFSKAGVETPKNDIEFVKLVESVAKHCNCRAIELCWAPWLLQYKEEERRKYLQMLNDL
ncbi:MAG: hypothetical protein ACK401_02840 [Archaeoglobaceae archaeon]